jgi:hypothetical protein
MAHDDPRRLIAEEDPGPDLAHALTSGIQHVQDLTAEMHGTDAGVPLTLRIAIDYGGNCSMDIDKDGASYQVVIQDGDAVETIVEGPGAEKLDGRWVRLAEDNVIAHKCDDGLRALVDGSKYATGGTWLLTSGRRIGMEEVRGVPALHVRQEWEGHPVDVWVAVIERRLLPVKIVHGGDNRSTTYLSRFNESTIRDLPPEDQIVDPATAAS